ncbi:MAG: peptidoglycan DD-metalloendopeptidase family protein [Methyloprofundus sp.]|nr:peptidoglycan DD-metalloendopeptidase family protein [Methyloprofundus sp.]
MHYKNNYYLSKRRNKKKKSTASKLILTALACTFFAISSYAFFSTTTPSVENNNLPLSIADIPSALDTPEKSVTTNIPVAKIKAHSLQSLSTIWQKHEIKSGESLSLIFSKNGLNRSDLHKIIHANDIGSQFAAITPGKTLLIGQNISGNLSHLVYQINLSKELKATRLDDGNFKVELIIKEIETHIASASGTIESSLFWAGKEAGLSDKLVMQLANIFAWDIDFALNLRAGDQFSLLYEKHFIDGKFLNTGEILAAEFINDGHSIKAVRYQDPAGKISYYTPTGESMRKAFLRTPIDFARISSHFNLRRKHPVLNKIRAHKGVDYAARTGTPIKSTGDGKIIFRGKKGGYGNVVIIKHGQRYSTLYAHLSKFKRGQRTGTRLNQGDIIGYVGKSGLATGPHLHYEFRVNGVHRNPLTVKLPNATPIKKKYIADFIEKASLLFVQLAEISPSQLATTQL